MSPVAQLLVATFFALNQYLPLTTSEGEPLRLIHDIRALSDAEVEERVFSAANKSCRYMLEVFFVETTQSQDASDPAVIAALQGLASAEGLESLIGQIRNTGYGARATRAQMDISDVSKVFGRMCSERFHPNLFTRPEAQQVRQLINDKIKVLDDKLMKSIGNFRHFGTAPLYDRKGKTLSTLNPTERSWVPFRLIPDNLIYALLATEDQAFESHMGIDPVGLARIAAQIGQGRSHLAGGSTITMQLLKNLFFGDYPEPAGSIFRNSDLAKLLRKAREIYWARPYETFNGGEVKGKQWVLEQYLNLVTFGPNIQGVAQAAQSFFSKPVAELTKAESAFIVSLLKNPFFYSLPQNFSKTSHRITSYILPSMWNNGFFGGDAAEYEQALQNHLPDPSYEVTPRESLGEAFTAITRWARQWLAKADIFSSDSRPQGVHVETTIDSQLQEAVFKATRQVLDRHDRSRSGSNRVGPALDETGRPAQVLARDMSAASLTDIKKGLEDLNALLPAAYGATIYLGESVRGGRFLSVINQYNQWSDDLKEHLKNLVVQPSSFVGELVVWSLSSNESCLPDLSDKDLVEQVNFKAQWVPSQPDCISQVDLSELPERLQSLWQEYSDQVRSRLVANALGRVTSARSRSDHQPALLDNLQGSPYYLVFEDGSRPKLKSSHRGRLETLMKRRRDRLRPGNMVWLKAVGEPLEVDLNNLDFCDVSGQSFCIPMEAPAPRPLNLTAVIASQDEPAGDSIESDPIVDEEGVIDMRSEAVREKREALEKSWFAQPIPLAQQYESFELSPPLLQAAVVVMDSRSGEVLAHFSGHNPNDSAFDRSRLAVRQPGSTIKPWIYFMALQKGIQPYDRIQNSGVGISMGPGQTWFPGGGSIGATVTLKQGLAYSQNKATVGLLKDKRWNQGSWRENLNELCQFLKDIGLYDDNLLCVPSLTLGSIEVSVLDMVRSYTLFSNGKNIVEPQWIKRVTDDGAHEYFQVEPSAHTVPNVTPTEIFNIRDMMIQVNNVGTVAERHDINAFLRNFRGKNGENPFKDQCFGQFGSHYNQSCFAGKTGTTNDAKNTWYVGYSDSYVIGVWVGYDQPETIGAGATGAGIAYPIFEEILSEAYDFLPSVQSLLRMDQLPEGYVAVPVASYDGKTCALTGPQINKVDKDFSGGYRRIFVTEQEKQELPPCFTCRCRMRHFRGNDFDYHLDALKIRGYNSQEADLYWKNYKKYETSDNNGGRGDHLSCYRQLLQWSENGTCPNDPEEVRSKFERTRP